MREDRLALFLCFGAFVVTFVVTRIITRTIRSGRGPFRDNVSGGLHVHHAVPGIVLMTVGAFLAVGAGSESPWSEIAGVLVGIGTSLVLDEFALILRLEDVYWAAEGRISVEMVSLTIGCLGLVLVGINPFEFDGDPGDYARISLTVLGVVAHVVLTYVCVAKGKFRMALFGAFIAVLALLGAARLARPGSRWARRRYDDEHVARAVGRAERFDARWRPLTDWAGDFVAGKTTEELAEPETVAR